MKKLIFCAIALTALLGILHFASARERGLAYHEVQFVDETGAPVTDITSINIYAPDSTTNATIYMDSGLQNAITQSITTVSANTTFTQSNGTLYWWGPDGYDFTFTNGTNIATNAGHRTRSSSEGRLYFPSYLTNITSADYEDGESVSYGSDDDWIANGGTTANLMTWTPLADGSVFNIGVSGTSLNSDFNVFVGTALGLKIVETTPTFAWDGGAATINHNSNFNVGLCTGTSTGAINFGGAASGAITIDTASTITSNSAGATAITTDVTSADITIDATDGSVIIDGGEAAADAIVIQSTGGGLDLTAVDDIDFTLTAGATAEDFTIQCAGAQDTTLGLKSSGTAANALEIITSAGGIDITTTGAAAGEDIDVSTDASVNITSTEDIATGMVLTAVGVDITASGGAAKDVDVTCTSGSVNITAGESAVDSIVISSSIGGIDITAAAAAAGEDVDITATGSSVNITSTESGVADGIVITASNESLIDVKGPVNLNSCYCLFEDTPIYAKSTTYGGACTGTPGDENTMMFPGATFLYHIIGTQTILGPTMTAAGFDIAMDLTENEGVEITPNILGRAATGGSRQAFIIDTDAFYLKVKIYVTDVSGTDDMLVGFRKVEAFQAAIGTYTDYAALKLQSGDIYIESDLNGAAAATDDTTDNWGDTTAVTLGILVDVTGAVTYTIDGSAPTSTQAFTFDTTDVVVPFIYMIHDADFAEATYLQSWECGLQY